MIAQTLLEGRRRLNRGGRQVAQWTKFAVLVSVCYFFFSKCNFVISSPGPEAHVGLCRHKAVVRRASLTFQS